MTAWHDQIGKHKLVLPSAIAGLKNGQLPNTVLTIVRNGNGDIIGKLEATAARAWTAMTAAAKADHGTILDATDTYRPLSVQQRIWDERYDHTDHGLGSRTCGGDRRFLKPHCAVVACPGTSNHGFGLAVDDKNQTPEHGLSWLEAHAHEFGFQWEVPSEVWHLHYWPGDKIPQAVLDFEHGTPDDGDDDVFKMELWKIEKGADAGQIWLIGLASVEHVQPDELPELERAWGEHKTVPGITDNAVAWDHIKTNAAVKDH